MKYIHISAIIAVILFATSCSSPKKVPYLIDAETIPTEVLSQIKPVAEPVFAPGDLLNIRIGATNMASVAIFNKNTYIDAEGNVTRNAVQQTIGSNTTASTEYYLVDKFGDIEFPVIGKLHIGGLAKSSVEDLIQSELSPKYLKEKPSVDIRLMNFRVTVLGAVGGPGIIESDNERMTILEAIAKAGDLDIKGQRENIMLIRTSPDGKREIHRLDLNDKNLLLSPYFNLQQNDVIYVQPNRSMAQNAWTINSAFGVTTTVVGTVSAIAALIIGIVNLSN